MARSPERISIADIITAIDGKPAMTECSRAENRCEHDTVCRLRNNWQLINELVFEVLDSLNLVEIKKPLIKRRISTFQCDHFQCSDVPRECGHGTPLLTVRI